MRSHAAVCLLMIAAPLPALAQSPAAAPSLAASLAVGDPPIVDGIVGAEEWENASAAGDFIQYEPRRGDPATRATEVLVLNTPSHLYVAFRVHDEEAPTAQLTRRDDDVMADDSVVVLLDTYRDRQSAYLFGLNLLGTQADARIVADGRTIDRDWDGAWEAAAARTDYGWSAEFAIPLSTLKYRSGESVTWGANFGRTRRRNLEIDFWTGPLDAQFRVSQAGDLTGLNAPPAPQRHRIVPYALGQAQTGNRSDGQVGIDARYEVTPSSSLIGTINPDFATIEADQERINLTRFELSQTEKRQFFMEGNELFRQRIRTFYSRRIADVAVGGKLQSRHGPWTIGALYARAESPEESDLADYSVLRVQRDLGRSSVAVTAADRGLRGAHQGSVGLDATLFFTPTFGMTAQLIQSYGPTEGGALAYFIRPSFDSPTAHFHVRYTHLGDNFGDNVNAIGFIRDDDRRELDSAFSKTFWVPAGPIERIQYNSNYNIYWSQKGVLRSWQIDQSFKFELRNRLSFDVEHTEEFKRFEKDFRNRQTGFKVGFNTREFASVAAGYAFGRNFDADFQLWSAQGGYKLTDGLSVEYELQRLELNPDPDKESTWIHVVRASQFFTPDLFLRAFLQTNSVIDRRNVQAVFVYRYLPPFGTLQLAYQRGTAEFGERSDQGDTLFVKATAVF